MSEPINEAMAVVSAIHRECFEDGKKVLSQDEYVLVLDSLSGPLKAFDVLMRHDTAIRRRIAALEAEREQARGLLERASEVAFEAHEPELHGDIHIFLQQLPTETETEVRG